MRPYAPDKKDPFPKPKGGGHNNNNNGGNPNTIGFMPRQMHDLAQDMKMGYGRSTDKWEEYLRDMYHPSKIPQYHFGGGHRSGNNNNGGGKDPRNPSGGPNPRHRSAPMAAAPMTFPLGFGGNMPMQQQPSAMAQPQANAQQLTPEMVNLLRIYMTQVQNVR